MIRSLSASLALLTLAAFTVPAFAGKPSGTEFKDGWTTFATAKEGDWVEYQVGPKTVRRVEVKTISGDKITRVEIVINEGQAGEPQEKKPLDWWSLKLPGTVPTNMDIKWTKEDVKVGGTTLKCDVASWRNGTLNNSVYFCKDVRCGGYVKMDIGGKIPVWLKNYGDKERKEGYLKDVGDPNAGKDPTLPAFYSTGGNVAVFKINSPEGESYVRRESENFDGAVTTFSDTPCDKDGKTAADAKPTETKWSNEDWAKRYGKPVAEGEKVKVAAGEFACAVYERTEGAKTVREWLTPEGLPAKSEIKDGDKVTTTELMSVKFR